MIRGCLLMLKHHYLICPSKLWSWWLSWYSISPEQGDSWIQRGCCRQDIPQEVKDRIKKYFQAGQASKCKNTGSPFYFRRCWLAVCILHHHFRISMDIVYTYMFNSRYLSMHFHVYVLAHVRGQRHSHGISPVFHVLSCHTVHELRQYTQQSRQSWNLKPMRFRFVLCAFPGYLTCFYGCVYRMFQNKVKGHKVSEPWMLHSFLIASLAIFFLTITTCSWNYIGWVEIQSIFNVHPGNLGKMKVFWSILTHMFLIFFQIHSWQKMHK